VLAGVIPFPALSNPAASSDQTDLRALADWARNSPPPALFLFPDSGTSFDPGIFRARSLRGLYVDWKSGGQVNYFSEFGRL